MDLLSLIFSTSQLLKIGSERRKLNGIIYMHRISDPRVGGVSRKNLRVFHSLCGEGGLKNVRIVTTYWGSVSEQEGNRREADLKNGAFKALVDAGAQMRRHTNNVASARQVMSELIPLQAVTMQVQKELHDGKKLSETAAGVVLTAEIAEMARNHAEKMANTKRQMELAQMENDRALKAKAEQERKDLEERVARENAERARMERILEEQRRAQEARREEERARIRRAQEQLAQQRREAQAQRDRANEIQRRLREEAMRREAEMQRHVAELNRRIAAAEDSDSDSDGCAIS